MVNNLNLLTSFRGQRHSRGLDIQYHNILYSGMIISGGGTYLSDSVGKSVEVYVPSTGQHCNLPDLPTGRRHHTMEEVVVCGGEATNTSTSCLSLTDNGAWERTTTLLEQRYHRVIFRLPSSLSL